MRSVAPWMARRARAGSETRRPRPASRPIAAVEPLEGRALLSAVPTAAAHRGVIPPSQMVAYPLNPQAPASVPMPNPPPRPFPILRSYVPKGRPLNERVFVGGAVKAPEFYNHYTGPNLDELNAVATTGRIVRGVGFVFTGTVLGPIDPNLPAHFIFGINRGVAFDPLIPRGKPPGPFPDRPDLAFDAAVDVTTGPTGPSGSVILYDAPNPALNFLVPPGTPLPINSLATFQLLGQQQLLPTTVTPLPSSDVSVSGDTVTAIVPLDLLPPTSQPIDRFFLSKYLYTFSPQLQPNVPNLIASFVPEYNPAAVAPPTGPNHAY